MIARGAIIRSSVSLVSQCIIHAKNSGKGSRSEWLDLNRVPITPAPFFYSTQLPEKLDLKYRI